MGLPRRWLCVFTKDAHKKYNKRFDDGVLDVDVDDGRIARLYKAEDERPTGEHIARRALTASELEAWLRGDDLSGFEGFDVQVDREVGGEAAGAPAAGASAATTAPAARPHPAALAARRPYRAPAMVGGAAFRPPQRKPPASASAAARPASRPAADARDAAPKRRRVDDDSHDLDDAGGRGIGDAMLEAVTRVAGGARGFADLYAEAAPEDVGTGASSSAANARANAKANAEANAKAPLAARPSKWEAYDTTAKVAKHSGAPEPRAVPAGGGDEGGLAAALRRAGGGGLAALRRAGGGGLDPGGGFSTAAPAAGDPETRPRRPKPPFAARANPPTGGLAATAAPGSSELALAFPNAEDASRILGVGGRERGSSVSATRENKTTLPSAFETAAAYRAFFRETIRADLLARLAETRLVLDRVAGASPSRAVPYGSNSSGGNVRTRPAHGAAGVDAEARRLAADLRAAKPDPADYYADCHLRQDKGGVDKGFFGRPKAKGAENEDDAGETSSPAAQPRKWWLHLNDQAERRGSRAYARGDLWVAGNTPRLLSSRALGEVGDRNKAPWTAVLQSLWHGPDKDGKLEVRVLTPSSGAGVSRGAGSLPKAGERRRVFAIRVEGNAASAVAEFETFANKTGTMSESAFPLLRHILGAPAESPPRVSDEDADEADARGLAAKHGLNDDQATAVAGALRAAAEAAEGRAAEALTACPVRLVHGPFGSGKTHALAAFIVEAAERLEAMKSDARILVAAHTNVAVDRLLSALAGKKFHQFVRVGSLRKIDREILPFALHVTSGGASRRAGDRDDEGPIVGESGKALRGKGADHARELRAMLRDGGAEMSAAERAALTREYDAARRGEADRRARALRTIRVVGATTASCASDALGGCSFAIAVLDECSQMTEPSSVVATARFGVRALVAVGDPQQLPPVLERKSARPEDPLARGLFARLVDAGHAPALLRTQYRLHPALAAVPNACFYGNKLVDGCSAEERAALVTVGGGGAEENGVGADGATTTARAIPMPPLTWIDVKSGGEERDGRSRLSRREAIVAAAAVSRLVELGVSPSDVGVITLYRAQAARVSRELAAAKTTSPGKTQHPGGDVRVSTVDAFQGQEKEVIVLSLCGDGGGGGAFTSRERVNVALTRAKRHLIVLGDSRHSAVRSHDAWAKCLAAARRAPGGFVDAAATLTDGLLRARLAKWRLVSRTREDEPTTRIDDEDESAAAAADGEVEIVGEREGNPPPRERDAAAALVATPADLAWEEEEAGDLAAREAKRVAGREAMAKARERAARTSADAVDREWETDEREREAEDEEEADEKDAAGGPASSSSDLDASSDLDSSDLESSGSLPPRLRALRSALAAPGVGLDPEAYWRAYADVTRGCLYQDADARARFERSAVGAVAASAFRFGDAPWGDAAWNGFALRRALLRDLVPAMKAHVHATRGRRWTRLGRLIAEFDDAETLAADVGGFGAHVVGDAETQEADEEGADIFARREAPSDDELFRPASP